MKKLTEPIVTNFVITWLSNNRYQNIKTKAPKEHGVDIQANTGYRRYLYIECKGEAKNASIKESNFRTAIGQIATRMDKSEYQSYALAFPESYYSLVIRRIPYQFAKRNKLFILLINSKGQIKKITWKELKNNQ